MFSITTKTSLVVILIFSAFSISFAGITDTIKNNQLVIAHNEMSAGRVIKEANVIYPALLEEQQEYFTAYVEKFSVNRRSYLLRTFARSKKFFPKANSILKKYKVPTEFAVLLALESAFNANAVSPAGAVGYWQIMDDVAKEYGLKIIEDQHKIIAENKKMKVLTKPAGIARESKLPIADERKNFHKSTHTAARYLKDRMRNLNNDWLLVAASYNWGVGNVWNAMQRTGKTRPSFWDIKNYLPAETKSYVMNFIALNVVFKNYENFKKGNLCFKSIKSVDPLEKENADCTMMQTVLKD
jgi:membrane-bound lytic murein transglycosylase MltF